MRKIIWQFKKNMKKEIERIAKWNEACGNTTFNRHLEASMMAEEFAELMIALKTWDKVEAVDAVLDMFIIWIWTLTKLGINPELIDECMQEILRSNDSKLIEENWKLVALKDSTGKILKPEHFSPANLKQILWWDF